MLKTTARANLRCVTRVDSYNDLPRFFGFVFQQVFQSLERPLVHRATLLCSALPCAGANLCQVLNHNRCALRHALNNTTTYNMVTVRTKQFHALGQFLQMTLGRRCAFALELALQSEVSFFGVLPFPLPEKAVVATYGRSANAKVNSDNALCCLDFGFGQCHNNVQPENAVALENIRTIETNGLRQFLDSVGIQRVLDILTALQSCQRNGVDVQAHSIASGVVTNWHALRSRARNFSTFLTQRERRFNRFSCTNARRANQLRRQLRVEFTQSVVGRFMQLDTVLLAALKTMRRHKVEASRVLAQGFAQDFGLFQSRFELKAYRSLHNSIVSYASRFCKLQGSLVSGETNLNSSPPTSGWGFLEVVL